MARKQTTDRAFAQAFRKALKGKPVRHVRAKTVADLEFEKMLADFKVNGAEHLASARKKMGQ